VKKLGREEAEKLRKKKKRRRSRKLSIVNG
jgi:hypothetical protein